jgi:hypothetical protein
VVRGSLLLLPGLSAFPPSISSMIIPCIFREANDWRAGPAADGPDGGPAASTGHRPCAGADPLPRQHRPHPAGDHDDRQRVSQRGPVGQRVRRSRRMLQHSEPPMPSWSASAPTAWASPQIAPPSPPAQPVPGPVHPDHPHPRRGQQPGREQAARYRAGAGPAMEGQARHPVRVPAIPCPILVIG